MEGGMNAGIPWAFGVQSNSTDMHLWQNRNEAYWTAQNCATATAIYTT